MVEFSIEIVLLSGANNSDLQAKEKNNKYEKKIRTTLSLIGLCAVAHAQPAAKCPENSIGYTYPIVKAEVPAAFDWEKIWFTDASPWRNAGYTNAKN